jgi:23S rRNA pseudouridine1911/1915/1917 synthase
MSETYTDYQEEQQELYEHHHYHVDAKQQALRIDKFLVNRMLNTSRNKIQLAATAGNILVNGQPVKPNYKVKPGDEISIVMAHPPREIEIIPEKIPLEILHEDDELIVINKQAGMVVHPGYGNYNGTLVNALTYHLQDLPSFENGEVRPGLVHRLDKNTSGIMVVAKTELALNHLANQFFNRTIKRNYHALVWGDMKEEEGTITGHIGRSLKDRKKMTVFPEGEHGKHAVTHYKVIERLGYVNLIECRLETGRTHQIRAHTRYIKHPVFNDETYGGDKILRGTTFTKYKQFVKNCFEIMPRHALHAKSLGFVHPESGENMFFDSDLPEDMRTVLDKWRAYTSARQNLGG